jgi:hypothetical protein
MTLNSLNSKGYNDPECKDCSIAYGEVVASGQCKIMVLATQLAVSNAQIGNIEASEDYADLQKKHAETLRCDPGLRRIES